jgi:type I restriction enzyme S subunit
MNGYPYGAIKQLTDYDAGVLSTLYLCFALTAEQCDPSFYRHFFEAGGMNRGIYSIAQEGARNHGLLNVSVNDFFGLSIPVPEQAEQRRLADLFDVADQELDLEVQYLSCLREQKKGLMQCLLTGQVRLNAVETSNT